MSFPGAVEIGISIVEKADAVAVLYDFQDFARIEQFILGHSSYRHPVVTRFHHRAVVQEIHIVVYDKLALFPNAVLKRYIVCIYDRFTAAAVILLH